MRIGLTYDSRDMYTSCDEVPLDYYGEFMTEDEADHLISALKDLGYQACKIGNAKHLLHFIDSGESVDLVFNMAEGTSGRTREAWVPTILEVFQIPYTFSDPLTLSLCLDKALTKQVWHSYGLPTAGFVTISHMSEFNEKCQALPDFPLFVKPARDGTSKGISARSIIMSVESLSTQVEHILTTYRQPALVEEFLPGREFTVGILGSGFKARVLGIAEIIMKDAQRQAYGFLEKEECETRVLYIPFNQGSLFWDLCQLALAAYRAVECQDAGRVDIRLDKGSNPKLLEINPLPGLHPTHSDLPIIASQAGLSYGELISEIVGNSVRRWHLQQTRPCIELQATL